MKEKHTIQPKNCKIKEKTVMKKSYPDTKKQAESKQRHDHIQMSI